ncbi:MAG: SprT-like domain-containing protein [bacterium]
MNLEMFLKYVESMTDLQALVVISNAVQKRYRELAKKKGKVRLAVGDAVSFHTKKGEKITGIIERRGKVNYRITAEDGKIYRVPIVIVKKENQHISPKLARLPYKVEEFVPLVLEESKRLLYQAGIELHVRYKKDVWATHFRQNRHIQFGEKCLRYQALEHKTSDNVAANLRKFKIKSNPESRIAMLVCHEVAHAIAFQRYGLNILPHGRQYYCVLNELVESEFRDIRNRFQEKLLKIQSGVIH